MAQSGKHNTIPFFLLTSREFVIDKKSVDKLNRQYNHECDLSTVRHYLNSDTYKPGTPLNEAELKFVKCCRQGGNSPA